MKQGLTEIVFVIDRSGSMYCLTDDTVGGFNSMLEQQKKLNDEALVSAVLFNGYSEVLYDRVKIQSVERMTAERYAPNGNTALLDALGGAIHHIAMVHKYAREEDVPEKTIFIITTDGMENASRQYTAETVKRMVLEKQEQGWEFIFLGANMDAVHTAGNYGIKAEHAIEYCPDQAGTAAVYRSVNSAVSELRSKRCVTNAWREDVEQDNRRKFDR